jgi:site-specific recombinase XerD
LEQYLKRRRAFTPLDDHVFVSLRRRSLLLHDAETAFHDIAEKIRLPRGADLPRPTIHSLRHYASDMLRGGVSLPALMRLMGHAHIRTTLIYVHVTPLEVYQQYARAVAQQIRPIPGMPS